MTCFEFLSESKAVQSSCPELCMLKAPWTWVRAGRSTLFNNQQNGSSSLFATFNLLSKVAIEVKGTSDNGKLGEAIDLFQHGVVRDLVALVY